MTKLDKMEEMDYSHVHEVIEGKRIARGGEFDWRRGDEHDDEQKLVLRLLMDYIQRTENAAKGFTIVCLGIGNGRELQYLYLIDRIKSFYGMDFHPEILPTCGKFFEWVKENIADAPDEALEIVSKGQSMSKKELIRAVQSLPDRKLELFQDDLLTLDAWKAHPKRRQIKGPIVYTILFNTIGMFYPKNVHKILENLRDIMRPEDALVLSAFKLAKDCPNHEKIRQETWNLWQEKYGERLPEIEDIDDIKAKIYLFVDDHQKMAERGLHGKAYAFFNKKNRVYEVWKFRDKKGSYPSEEELIARIDAEPLNPPEIERIAYSRRWEHGEIDDLFNKKKAIIDSRTGDYVYALLFQKTQ